MRRNILRAGNRVAVFIFFIGLWLCVVYPPTDALKVSSTNIMMYSSTNNTINLSMHSNITSFPDFYQYLVEDNGISTHSIILNGSSATIIELPNESIAVQLPDNLIAVHYSDQGTSLMPSGSNVTNFENQSVVVLPDQRDVLLVSKVVVSPMEQFVTTATFSQSVEALDSYQVTAMFPMLSNQNPDISLIQYSIDWGDGTITKYPASNISATHMYQKSGHYQLAVNASDSLGFSYGIQKPFTVLYEGDVMHSVFWVQKNKEPVAVTTSTGISLLALCAVALTETGKYKLLLFLTMAIPLYTRIQKEDVLDQFVRGQIYGYIKTNPGAYYNQIRRQIGVKNGTLSYHLGVLEKTELIQSRREGLKYRAFYPTGMKFPQAERFRLTELQIRIINAARKSPGITQKEIAEVLHAKPQTVNYNVRVLSQAELLDVMKDGRKTRCYAKPESSPDVSFT